MSAPKKRWVILRRQKPIPGGRGKVGASVLREIEAAVTAEAMRYGASKSFVMSVRLAASYGIKGQEPL